MLITFLGGAEFDLARSMARCGCGKPCFSFVSPVGGLSGTSRGHSSGGQHKPLPRCQRTGLGTTFLYWACLASHYNVPQCVRVRLGVRCTVWLSGRDSSSHIALGDPPGSAAHSSLDWGLGCCQQGCAGPQTNELIGIPHSAVHTQ